MKIIVSNLSSNTTEAQLSELFGKFGTVESVTIPMAVKKMRTGIVVMKDRTEGRKAIQMLHHTRFQFKVITVKEALAELAATPVIRMFVTNLHPDAGDQDLYDLFVPYGHILSAVIPPDMFGQQSGGCGYVEMTRREEGLNALAALHNALFMGQQIEVRIIPSATGR